MIRVFLVDDHEVVRRGVEQLINADPACTVVGESATVRGSLGRIAATVPDVVLLDVHLPDGSGIDLCRDILSEHPSIRCLMFTGVDDDAASVAAVLAGASGYVLKNIRGNTLIASLHRVSRGESLVTRELATRVHASLAPQQPHSSSHEVALTLRERQALELITEGLTNRQIGDRLGLAEKTVKNYVSGLLAKLGMERRTQAAVYGATRPQRPSATQS